MELVGRTFRSTQKYNVLVFGKPEAITPRARVLRPRILWSVHDDNNDGEACGVFCM